MRDLPQRSLAVDLLEKIVLVRIDGQHEFGMLVRRIEQHRGTSGGNAIANAQRPGQPDRNVLSPPLLGETDGLARTGAIFPVGHEIVLGDRSPKQFDGSMLRGFGQSGQPRGVPRSGSKEPYASMKHTTGALAATRPA